MSDCATAAAPATAPRLLTVEEARRAVLEPFAPTGPERVPPAQAQGRTLAAPVRALEAAPPFDASEMDGYAVRAAEVARASAESPVRLPIAFETHAGDARGALEPGHVSWIATGASLPQGADAVVPREVVLREAGDAAGAPGAAIFRAPVVRPGAFVRRAGDDWSAGETLLAPGAHLGPAVLALAASAGAAELTVRRRPTVGLLATGDELREPGRDDAPLPPGAVRESNRIMLGGLATALGAAVTDLGIVRDDLAATTRALDDALLRFDLVLTIGGASVGERDLVRPALAALGCAPRFMGVAVKPGKPLALAVRERPDGTRGVCIVLPGNPASALTGFHLFVAPALRRLLGHEAVEPAALDAVLASDAAGSPDRRTYLRARLTLGAGGLRARPLARQASGSVRGNAEANALVVLEAGARKRAGESVRVEPLPGFAFEEATS